MEKSDQARALSPGGGEFRFRVEEGVVHGLKGVHGFWDKYLIIFLSAMTPMQGGESRSPLCPPAPRKKTDNGKEISKM